MKSSRHKVKQTLKSYACIPIEYIDDEIFETLEKTLEEEEKERVIKKKPTDNILKDSL